MSALLYPERHLAVTLNEVKGAMLDMAPFAALRVTRVSQNVRPNSTAIPRFLASIPPSTTDRSPSL